MTINHDLHPTGARPVWQNLSDPAHTRFLFLTLIRVDHIPDVEVDHLTHFDSGATSQSNTPEFVRLVIDASNAEIAR